MSTASGLPEYGQAAVVVEWGAPLEIREFPLLGPEPGVIAVRIDRSTICGSDIHAWKGTFPGIELPIILGHEQVGEIIAFGDGASRVDSVGTPLRLGDRIVWAHESCGQCHACTVEGMATLCTNRYAGFVNNANSAPHFHGSFGQYGFVRPKAGRLRVPDTVTSAWASASSCALRTVVDAVERAGLVDYRHNVVVQGAGPLGLFATAMFAMHQPRRLIVIGGPAERLALAEEWGADVTISVDDVPEPAARRELVLEATDGRGGDVIGDFSGAPGVVGEGIELAALNARYVVVGSTGGSEQPIAAYKILLKNLRIFGSYSAEIGAYHKAMDFMARTRDRYDWDRMVGNTYGLADANVALSRMLRMEDIKAVIDPFA